MPGMPHLSVLCKSVDSRHSAEKRNPENILKKHYLGGKDRIPLFSGMTAWHWAAKKQSGKKLYDWKDDSLYRTHVNL